MNKAALSVTPSRLAATLAFDGAVGQVRAVSGQRSSALSKMGIHTVRDLLTHFPRRYIDMSTTATIAQAPIGSSCTISGEVYEVKLKRPKPRLSLTEITLLDGTATMIITCFRQPWLAEKLHKGSRIAVSGKVEFNYGFKRMVNPFMEELEGEHVAAGMIIPVHPASEKVPTAWMRRLVANGLELCRGLDDPLPLELRLRYRLLSRQAALNAIHFPVSMDEVAMARRRLTYEELLLLELHLLRQNWTAAGEVSGFAHVVDGAAVRALDAALPFKLTAEQQQARAEILGVLALPRRANHMLLGDVGTGKTAVAAFALACAADSGTQAFMMAPTEVLATQYAEKLGPLLDKIGVSWALLTGSTGASQRSCILEALASGELCICFGTHALLEPDVQCAHCSLVVIDEQQRFGVKQRETLCAKGESVDVLSLTATPIPRSLALALFGNMSLSYIKQRPHSASGTHTVVYSKSMRGDAYDAVLAQLQAGHQAYVVCPLVGESESKSADKAKKDTVSKQEEDDYLYSRIAIETEDDLEGETTKAALQHALFLQEKVFAGYAVGVLHGRMKSEEKHQIMADFRKGLIQVLVSTTVIEVGVDVPNATAMVIEDADRFGLSQLHQLRGRVGRGEYPGVVCLISGSKAPAAMQRLAAMESTDDGFRLAEYDLSLRREGDILGNRQHGASVLKLVNVVRDAAIIEAAHADAEEILTSDPSLSAPEHAALSYELARTFPQ